MDDNYTTDNPLVTVKALGTRSSGQIYLINQYEPEEDHSFPIFLTAAELAEIAAWVKRHQYHQQRQQQAAAERERLQRWNTGGRA